MKKMYIDCDGVILDTERGLFERLMLEQKRNPSLTELEYLQKLDWHSWLRQAGDINDSIYILNHHNPDSADILTTVQSIEEGFQKISYFRELGVKNNIILVPYQIKKCDIVNPSNHILIDNACKRNLDPWFNNGGLPVLFTMKDEEQRQLFDYYSISSLEEAFIPDFENKVLQKINRV
jgi:hypothetical protein